MTREQQRQLKELNTQLSRTIKELCAQYKIKKKDGRLFYKKENMFYKAIISITTPSDDVWYCETEELIKPPSPYNQVFSSVNSILFDTYK